MRRFLILAIAVGGLVLGFNVKTVGAVEIPPAKNPLCWEKAACEAIVKKNWGERSYVEKYNFVSGKDSKECGTGRGYCIPATKAQTAITVGDNSVFNNLGDYIKNIYIYLISIGGLIAAILVIKGGFEYVTSTGNSQRVEGAKETIRNALIGLALLFGSYTLLYTINPDLLKLKLPRVYMLREIALPSQWCKDQPEGTKLAVAIDYTGKERKEVHKSGELKESNFSISAKNGGDCGRLYFVSGGGNSTCAGSICLSSSDDKRQVCVPPTSGDKYECKEGKLSGSIEATNIDFPFVTGDINIYMVCGNYSVKNAGSTSPVDNKETKKQVYVFQDKPSLFEETPACNNIKGYFLTVSVNEDWGMDDLYAVGRSGTCSVNLNSLFPKILELTGNGINGTIESYLIKPGELKDGTSCTISLTRQAFPTR